VFRHDLVFLDIDLFLILPDGCLIFSEIDSIKGLEHRVPGLEDASKLLILVIFGEHWVDGVLHQVQVSKAREFVVHRDQGDL
jgi:hypothetical protein